MREADVEVVVYPDDCDQLGGATHSALVRLFERARWETWARGPGIDVFSRHGLWPVVRRSVLDFHAPVRAGDRLRCRLALTHLGRTSFAVRQTAVRADEDLTVATSDCLLVCVDRAGHPQPVPDEIGRYGEPNGVAASGERVVVNGVALAIENRGSGPAVVFIHGFPLDRQIWRHQVDSLTGFRRIAYDLRGLGRSDAPDLGYSMATYADDLAGLLDVLGEERVVLCGLSMGGYVAFEFLRRHRERVRGLVLMDTRAEADSAEGRRSRDALVAKVREQGAMAAAEAMLPRLFSAGVPTDIIQAVRTMILDAPVPGIVGALTAMRDRVDSAALLPTLIGIPSLVIVGQDDVITPPAVAATMASALPDGRLVEIPGAGHLPCLEQPIPTTRALVKFLQALG